MTISSTHELLGNELLSANDVLLVPRRGIIPSRGNAEIDPFIYSAPMDTVTNYSLAAEMLSQGEFPVISRFLGGKHGLESEEYQTCLHEFSGTPAFFATSAAPDKIAALNNYCKENKLVINAAIDVAHGDSVFAETAAAMLVASKHINGIMSGSICTGPAAERATLAGCTHLRVGVGPGAACTTRLMTGIGFPQLSAIYRIHMYLQGTYQLLLPENFDVAKIRPLEEMEEIREKYLMRNNVKIISDGGIKLPGDGIKYMAAGADAIMMGSRFSKAEESPGWTSPTFSGFDGDSRKVKSYRGQASAEFQNDQFGRPNRCPEGKSSSEFEWDGTTVGSVIDEFRGGLASAISYLGLESSREMDPDNVTFIKITSSTYLEGTPHGV